MAPRKPRFGLGRKRVESAGSLNAVEVALDAERDDVALDGSSRLLLADQRRLIRSQIASERLGVTLRFLTALVGVAAAAVLGWMVVAAAGSNAVIVQAFDAPTALANRGLTGKVVASGLQDALTRIQSATRTTAQRRSIANAWTSDIAVEVPQTGVSLGEIDRLLRQRLGDNTYVSGDLIQAADGGLSLTVRGDGVLPRTFTGPPESLAALTTQAAEYIYGSAEAYLFATYLNQADRPLDAIAFLAEAYPKADDSVRAQLANSWGLALGTLGRDAESAEKYRLAIQVDPTYWRAWGNLVGALYTVEGEEAAYRTGMEMRRLAAADPGETPPDALTQQNMNLLAQEWTDYIAGSIEDVRISGGGSSMNSTANPTLAEAEARRHGWGAAERYLAASDPEDTVSAPTRLLVGGYRALEAGEAVRAVELLEPFDAAWRADPDLMFTYSDAPCWLGLAYALSGRRAEAEALFARMGRWVSCYAFQADGLEAAGDRAAADLAYGRAIRLAPSLPFAYQRRGLALMARGEFRMAAGRFRDAHQRGPRWADPLKGWGDALAAQGLWARAVEKYQQAEPLAPNWRELNLAHAIALDRLGRGEEAGELRRKAAS